MTQPDAPDRDDAALAAEFALHLLDAAERAAFEKRLAVEPGLQALVRDWDKHFAGLAAGVPSVAPPRRLKKAIDVRLHGPETAQADTPLWLRWRLFVGGGIMAALIVMAAMFGNLFTSGPAGPQFQAELAAADRSLVVLAGYDPGQGTLTVDPVTGAAPAGRVLELWLIAPGASAPVSLGVFAEAGTTTLTVPDALRDQFAEAVLAISDEPPGGSPTGAPTGSVLATGTVTIL